MLASLLLFAGLQWSVPDPVDWRIQNDTLQLVNGKEPPSTGPRRPFQFALADTHPYKRVHVEADIKPLAKSVMVVFAYKDGDHFDYAHLSTDTAAAQPHHNGIFHVYGGERVRISSEAGPAAFPATRTWHHVVLDWDGSTGTVDVRVDGKPVPALHAVDVSLKEGKVGLGSFDETAEFRNVAIH